MIRLCKNVNQMVVATSDLASDDSLVDYCLNNKINYYRGSLNNVLSRYTIL